MMLGINVLALIFALILIYFAFILVNYLLHTRPLITIGVAQVAQTKAYEAHPQTPRMRILIIGDSSAVGVGTKSPLESVAGRLGQDYPDADITNLAVSGSKTADLIPVLQGLSANDRYDLILIQIGGNDIVRRTPYKDLERDLPKVFELAKQHSPNVVQLTSGNVGTSKLLPAGTRWFFTLRTKAVRNIFMRIAADQGVHYVDLYRTPANDPYAQGPDKYYSADYFHPSGDGYGDWYSFVKITVAPLPGFEK